MWRFLRILCVMAVLLGLPGVGLRADEAVHRTLSNEVIGTEWAAPGDTVGFRVTIDGGIPGTVVTVYEQIGSNLSFAGISPTTPPDFERYCVISALPAENLPGADPAAPAENRVACSVMTDDAGVATLTLSARVNRQALGPPGDATTRGVAAVRGLSTDAGATAASAQIQLLAVPR
jgi:hypothetical protein